MVETPAPTEPEWIKWYSGWVSAPQEFMKLRGMVNAIVGIYPGGIVAYPSKAELWVTRFSLGRSWWPRNPIVYGWPTVVIERIHPFGTELVLVDVDGQLGGIYISGGRRLRRENLSGAGFNIMEARAWGWDTPRAIPPDLLGDRAAEIPPCASRGGSYWPRPRLLRQDRTP